MDPKLTPYAELLDGALERTRDLKRLLGRISSGLERVRPESAISGRAADLVTEAGKLESELLFQAFTIKSAEARD